MAVICLVQYSKCSLVVEKAKIGAEVIPSISCYRKTFAECDTVIANT